jgi:hypothetical protein
MEPSKNIGTLLGSKTDQTCLVVTRLCNSILYVCSPKLAKKAGITEAEVVSILLPCLRFIVGGGRPYRMVYAVELKTAFTNIRSAVMKENLFRRIRGVLTIRSDPLISLVQDHYDSSSTSNSCICIYIYIYIKIGI